MRAPEPPAPATPPARPVEHPDARALARATAGAITYEDDGRVAVLLPPPGAVLAREEAAPGVETADARPGPHGPARPADARAAPPPPEPRRALDRDELYEDFLLRLRRDVREQREQIGELF